MSLKLTQRSTDQTTNPMKTKEEIVTEILNAAVDFNMTTEAEGEIRKYIEGQLRWMFKSRR